jgi:NYN domain
MQTLTLAPPRSILHTGSSPLSSHRLHILLFFRSPFSSSSSSSSSSRRTESLRKHNSCDEESKGIKVSVWWDYENCAIPAGVNVYRIANRIVTALRSSGIRGPVSINAFGDMWQMPRTTQEVLISTGICLTHAPNSE